MRATGSVLLDTSVVVAHFRGDPALTARLAEAALYLPWVVVGELHYGAQKAKRREEAIAQVREFLRIAIPLWPDNPTLEQYGQIKAEIAEAGTPIPDNDIWIAALAREYELPLVTRDHHFAVVPGLKTFAW